MQHNVQPVFDIHVPTDIFVFQLTLSLNINMLIILSLSETDCMWLVNTLLTILYTVQLYLSIIISDQSQL